MSSSDIGPQKEDRVEKYYRVDPIEPLRSDEKREKKGDSPKEPPEGNKTGLFAFALFVLNKILDLFQTSIKQSLSKQPFREDLLLLKEAFETIMREDQSQEAPFLKRLSKLWQQLLEHSPSLYKKSALNQSLKTLIKDIESYPDSEEHTFGYYLDHYAGQKWLPFPYMDMIQKLHHDHVLEPASSLLSRWTQMIQQILNLSEQ